MAMACAMPARSPSGAVGCLWSTSARGAAAKRGRCWLAAAGGAGPQDVSAGVGVKAAIGEVAAEQSELPHLVGDVLADVGNGAVRAHDDLGIVVPFPARPA